MVLSIIAFVIAIAFQPSYDEEELTLKEFWLYKTHQTDKYDLLMIGDSRVYRGLSPKELENTIGLRAFNLGYSSGGMSEPLFDLANRSLTKSPRSTILLGITPHALTPNGLVNKQLVQLLKDSAQLEVVQMPSNYARLFESFRPSTYLQNADSSKFDEYNRYLRNGWCASYSPKDDPERTLSIYRKNFHQNSFDSASFEVFIRQVSQWSASSINVVAFRVPSTIQMEALEDSLSGVDMHYVSTRLKGAGATWLNFDSKDYRSYDGSHLHFESARQFSRDLGSKLKLAY